MACFGVHVKNKEDFIRVQLVAFYLGFHWFGSEAIIDRRYRNYIFLYKSSNSKYITKSDDYLTRGNRTGEIVKYILLEDFLNSNINDF